MIEGPNEGKVEEGGADTTSKWPIPFITIWIGIAALLVAPALLTLPARFSHLDFSETGQIGDTIGGITAPFINLTAAILVYYSFKQSSSI